MGEYPALSEEDVRVIRDQIRQRPASLQRFDLSGHSLMADTVLRVFS